MRCVRCARLVSLLSFGFLYQTTNAYAPSAQRPTRLAAHNEQRAEQHQTTNAPSNTKRPTRREHNARLRESNAANTGTNKPRTTTPQEQAKTDKPHTHYADKLKAKRRRDDGKGVRRNTHTTQTKAKRRRRRRAPKDTHYAEKGKETTRARRRRRVDVRRKTTCRFNQNKRRDLAEQTY